MYVKTLLALIFLMVATIVAAEVHFPGGTVTNNIVAMVIAITKALLVISFFMHVKFGTTLIKLWCLIGFVWMPLMFFIIMDYGTRKYEPAPAFEADRGGAMLREVERRGEKPPVDDIKILRVR